jgi:ribonuclease Z
MPRSLHLMVPRGVSSELSPVFGLEACLPNGSAGDSLVLLRLPLQGATACFDAGDPRRLPAKDVLRLVHLFVSHAHVDHFVGFDALVRPRVCRAERLWVHGPPGFLDRVEARLRGYTWNLVDGNHFVVMARASEGGRVRQASFDSGDEFRRRDLEDVPPGPCKLDDAGLVLETAELDHHVVSMGYAVQRLRRLRVRPEALATTGLQPGPWLTDLKRSVLAGRDDDAVLLPDGKHRRAADVAAEILDVEAGVRVAYVTDTICNRATRPRIVELARGADVFACGAPFLSSEAERARMTRHLTAEQAGSMAREAGAKELLLFHVSDRYGAELRQHADEAHDAAKGDVRVVVSAPWPVQE